MPSLQDLLEFLAMPANEHIWLLFDIKMDNDMEEVFRLMAKTVQSVRPAPGKPWRERLVLGCWAVSCFDGRLVESHLTDMLPVGLPRILRDILPRLSHYTHRLLNQLRSQIPPISQCLLQHASAGSLLTLRTPLPPEMPRARPLHLLLDSQRRNHDAMVYSETD